VRDGQADADAAAGDHGGLAAQVEVHGVSRFSALLLVID
jgi:hypothetical protein